MIARIFFLLFGLYTTSPLFSQSINTEKSEAKFSISNIGINTVKGNLTGMEGSIHFNPKELRTANFDVCVNVNTIKTGIGKRDEHLQSDDFFHANEYPTICFKSNSVTKTDAGYETIGTLTMHGVSKPVTIPFTYTDKVFNGKFTVNRLDYKVGEDTSTFTAGEEVELEITCVTQ